MRSLDDLLDSSAPRLNESGDGLDAALVELVASTKRTAAARRRKPRRAVLVGATAAALMVGGTGAAAAKFGGWIAPWAEHPLGTLTFQLPSGGVCEQRIGGLKMDDPAAQTMIQEWLSEHTLDEIADVDAALRQTRSWDDDMYYPQGGLPPVKVGYGTRYYDADYEYVNAVAEAEYQAIDAKLKGEGFTEYVQTEWESELQCSGSNPYPNVPAWRDEIDPRLSDLAEGPSRGKQ